MTKKSGPEIHSSAWNLLDFHGPGRDAVQVPALRIGLFGGGATGRKDEHKNVPVLQLTPKLAFAAAMRELQLLDGRWHITYTGLLRIARRAQEMVNHLD
jgi:hypothetical protein